MIRISALGGRAVVDLDAAEKLGSIDKIILDPEGRHVAGFVVSHGSSLFNSGTDTILPASSVHAIGPDAVTVRVSRSAAETAPLDDLPRVSDLVGRKVVSEEGRFLGTVDDVLVDETDGRIVGYTLSDGGPAGKLGEMISGERKDNPTPYLRADANLRAGQDLIVAPEDAVSRDWALLGRPVEENAPVTDSSARRWVDTTADRGPTQWVRSARDRKDLSAIKPIGEP
ncbi:MAG: PRC-barrel domain-containing protein [Vicinamibacterales bacterium]